MFSRNFKLKLNNNKTNKQTKQYSKTTKPRHIYSLLVTLILFCNQVLRYMLFILARSDATRAGTLRKRRRPSCKVEHHFKEETVRWSNTYHWNLSKENTIGGGMSAHTQLREGARVGEQVIEWRRYTGWIIKRIPESKKMVKLERKSKLRRQWTEERNGSN